MTYLDVLTDIGAIANDPNLDSLKDRAKDHFMRAVSAVISSGEYSESDIPGSVRMWELPNWFGYSDEAGRNGWQSPRTQADTNPHLPEEIADDVVYSPLAQAWLDLGPLKILKIVGLLNPGRMQATLDTPSDWVRTEVACFLKTHEEIAKLAFSREDYPTEKELYFWSVGNYLYAWSIIAKIGQSSAWLKYIKQIDDSEWTDDTVLTKSSFTAGETYETFSVPFLNKITAMAGATLLAEDSQ